VRRLQSNCLGVALGSLCAALNQHPQHKLHDFSWFHKMLTNLPVDPESLRRERKERKYLPYDTVAEIPNKIRATRNRPGNNNPSSTALLVRDELLMLWLVTMPWRQRNLRECRIGLKCLEF